MKYKLFIFFILSFSSVYSQSDTVDVQEILDLKRSRPIVGLEYEIGAANNSISYSSLLEYRGSEFLTNNDKQTILDDASSNIKLGFWQSFKLSWNESGRSILGAYAPGKKITFRHDFLLGVKSPKDGLALSLFGNKQFENSEFSLDNSAYETWWYTAFDYEYDFKSDSSHFTIGGSLLAGHQYESYHVNKGDFFTAENGEFIDADLEYDLIRSDSQNQIPLEGVGIGAIFSWEKEVSESYFLKAGVRDLGIMYWNNVEFTEVDSSFRFQGVVFDNIFDITDSLRDAEADQITNGFYSVAEKDIFRLLPFTANIQLKRVLKTRVLKSVYLHSDYRYLYGYNPRFGLGSEWRMLDEYKLYSELNYGGFNKLALAIGAEAKLWDRLFIKAQTNNILALVLPNQSTGTSATLGIFYEL